MRNDEAMALAKKINANPNGTDGKLPAVIAQVVRILPGHTDPILPGDDGWDVEVTVLRDDDTILR